MLKILAYKGTTSYLVGMLFKDMDCEVTYSNNYFGVATGDLDLISLDEEDTLICVGFGLTVSHENALENIFSEGNCHYFSNRGEFALGQTGEDLNICQAIVDTLEMERTPWVDELIALNNKLVLTQPTNQMEDLILGLVSFFNRNIVKVIQQDRGLETLVDLVKNNLVIANQLQENRKQYLELKAYQSHKLMVDMDGTGKAPLYLVGAEREGKAIADYLLTNETKGAVGILMPTKQDSMLIVYGKGVEADTFCKELNPRGTTGTREEAKTFIPIGVNKVAPLIHSTFTY